MKKLFLTIIVFSSLITYGENLVIQDSEIQKTDKNITKSSNTNISKEKQSIAYWEPYMIALERKIKNNWTPPKSDISKRVVVVFEIAKDGKLLSSKITKSSGNKKADRAALDAIIISEPFKPLPSEFKGESVPIEFTFDYNILGPKTLTNNTTASHTTDFQYNNSDYVYRHNVTLLTKSEQTNPLIDDYVKYISKKIEENWKQPLVFGPNKTLYSCLRFNIHKDGSISDIGIVRSSESDAFDNSMLKAINKVGKFNALPEEIKDEYIYVYYSLEHVLKNNSHS